MITVTKDPSKLDRVRRLVVKRVGGEKSDIDVKLLELANKLGIKSFDEIESSENKLQGFSYNGKLESKLLVQCMYEVMGENRVQFYSIKGQKQIHAIYCTNEEAMKIQMEFDFYKKVFYEKANAFLDKFIDANNIFPGAIDEKKELDGDLLNRFQYSKDTKSTSNISVRAR